MKLEGKAALVTGAGSGIGRAIALLFATEGAKVMATDVNEEGGRAVARQVEDSGGSAQFIRTDVSIEAEVKAAIEATIEACGGLDILVNNAGIGGPQYPWERIIAVNLSGVYYGCQHGLAAMTKQGGGAIVNIASIAGLVGGFGQAYTAAKHGVIGLTRQFALDGAPHGVRVNCICPGFIDTPLTAMVKESEPLMKWAIEGTPLGRLGQPEEIAQAALFLASDDPSFMTGAPLIVDGGWTAR